MNCTVADNVATGGGSAVSCNTTLDLTNSIVWGDLTADQIIGSASVTYSAVQGGYTGIGNTDQDPLFVNGLAGDYALQPLSPCVDTATADGAPDVDLRDVARPQGAGIDMGAYEAILRVSAPAVGEEWTPGMIYTIRWEANPSVSGADVRLALHRGGEFVRWITRRTANDGAFAWLVPTGLPDGLGYSIRLQAYDDSADRALSPIFTIASPVLAVTVPNGGEQWQSGVSYNITWDSNGAVGDDVNIALFKDGAFLAWLARSTPNDGEWLWTVPRALAVDSGYLVRVQSYANPLIRDYSDATFAITPPPLIVTSPNGGEQWVADNFYPITWDVNGTAAGDYVRIGVYIPGGSVDWINRMTPNDGEYTWKIPIDMDFDEDHYIRVQSYSDPSIFDDSDGNLQIVLLKILQPNGSNHWVPGEKYPIRWDSRNLPETHVRLGLHRGAGFVRWLNLRSENDGLYWWIVPNDLPLGPGYALRIQGYDNPLLRDLSDRPFSLVETPLTLTFPNGGEVFTPGEVIDITWTSNPDVVGPYVRIGWHLGTVFGAWISQQAPNTGILAGIEIPSEFAGLTGLRFRIQSADEPLVRDYSDGFFSIASE